MLENLMSFKQTICNLALYFLFGILFSLKVQKELKQDDSEFLSSWESFTENWGPQ